MRPFVRENGLTVFFATIFLLALVAQSLVGTAEFNNQQRAAGQEPVSYGHYLLSSGNFAVDVAENWQSEFLQFTLYILAHRLSRAGGIE